MTDTLCVRARGLALIVNYEALEAGARRFVGRVHDPKLGKNGGWPPDAEPHSVPNRAEYRKAVADGSLWAADEATAKACGVKFDSAFGASVDATKPEVTDV